MDAIINDNFSYKSKLESTSIEEYKSCLEKFRENFDDAKDLKGKLPIFFDTNVLLRYYSISFTAREKLFKFISDNKDRIYITTQVQSEFLKNREEVIQKFFDQVTNKIPTDFNSEIINKITNFTDKHKIVLKDYSSVEAELNSLKDSFKELLKKLNEAIDIKKNENLNLLVNDDFLDLICSCNMLPGLSQPELQLITRDYDELASKIKKSDNDNFKDKYVFPGVGDLKEKPDYPYGDFIIYHEILKYISSKSENTIFLTFDNTKGDWMKKNKSPHLHYVENVFKNTENILYIIDAERTLNEILEVNIDSLIINEVTLPISSDILTIEAIRDILCTLDIFKNLDEDPDSYERIMYELDLNGYKSMQTLISDIKKSEQGFRTFLKVETFKPTVFGALRILLLMANDDYDKIVHENFTTISQPSDYFKSIAKKYSRFNRSLE